MLRLRLLFFVFCLSFLTTEAQIKMNSSGNVSIGSFSPNFSYHLYTGTIYTGHTVYFGGYQNGITFDFYGYGERRIVPTSDNKGQVGSSSHAFNKMYSYDFMTVSDQRHKENIRDLSNALNKVKAMKGVKYDLREDRFDEMPTEVSADLRDKVKRDRKNHVGFLAQDLMKVLPEAVVYDDTTDVYAINYTKVIPVLVEAIKEQQLQIERLEQRLKDSKNTQGKSVQGEASDRSEEDSPQLFPNIPNPFDHKTVINYYLPSRTSSAKLIFYDLNGRLLKDVILDNRGQGAYTLEAGDMEAGIYFYSVIADGESLGIHKMVIN